MLKMKTWLALAMAGACATGVRAQSFGYYEGLTEQGRYIGLQVTDDGMGNPVLTWFAAGWDPTCSKTGMDRYTGFGLGPWTPFADGKTSFEFLGTYLKMRGTVRDDGANVLSGSFSALTAEFVDGYTSGGNQAQRCGLRNTTFTATLVPEARRAAPALQPGQALQLK